MENECTSSNTLSWNILKKIFVSIEELAFATGGKYFFVKGKYPRVWNVSLKGASQKLKGRKVKKKLCLLGIF